MVVASETTNELAAALSQAQGAFPEIERTRTVRVSLKGGGGYEFDYAPLDSIIAAVKPILAENGLSFRHSPHVEYSRDEGGDIATVTQTCRLEHMSGQWTEATIALRTRECDPQKIGSALTYGRRYSLEHVLGIAAQVDDDGNAASGNESHSTPRETMPECPKCHSNAAVIKSKEEYGGGYTCWKNKGGCNAKWGGKKKPVADNGGELPQSHDPPEQAGDPGTYAKALKAVAGITDHPMADRIGEMVEERRQQGKLTDAEADSLQEMIVAKQKLIETEAQQALEAGATA